MNKNILITGGAGYIGSLVARNFIDKKFKVFIIDNLDNGFRSLIPKSSIFFKGDLKNFKFVRDILKKYDIKNVLHFAAKHSVKESDLRPKLFFENNVNGMNNLLKACEENNCENFIFSSTAAVYGHTNGQTIKEKSEKIPISNYARTKYICEKMLEYYAHNKIFRIAILRYFNVVGSDLRKNHGCLYDIEQLFKTLASNIIKKKYLINVYGNNYKTKDGTCIRDYIHVKDLSKIHYLSFIYLLKEKKNLEINCGYGKGYSVLDIIRAFENKIKKKIQINFLSRRTGDQPTSVANVTLLKKLLKFNPRHNSIDEMVSDTLIWEKKINWKK